MSFALWSLLVAGLLPLVFTGWAKLAGSRGGDRYDNANPRAWLANREGVAARAHAAQQNGFEWYPLYVAGILACVATGTTGSTIDLLAGAYLVLRLGYGLCYVFDLATLRSLVWFGALGVNVGLFVLAA